MTDFIRDRNHVPVAGGVSSADATVTLPFKVDSSTGRLMVDATGSSGTVTSVSVVSANGFAGTVATATTTPAITLTTTITGILSGNGTAISAAATTGSGSVVLATSPTLVTPILGTPTSVTLTNGTGLPITAGTTGTLGVTRGGTGVTAISALSIWVANAANTIVEVTPGAGNSIRMNGAGTAWEAFTPSASVPTTITVANEATDTTCFLGFFTAATGDLAPKTNANLTFNSSTGVLTLVAPVLGTPTSVTLTNATGLPISTGLTGAGTGVLTALGINVGSAGAFVTFNGALGTPSSGTVTNLTGTASININGTVGATTPAAGTFTAAIANSFVPNSATIPSNGIYLPAANTLGWAINSAAEMQLTATALSPATDDGLALGTTALGWQSLFGDTGFVLNIENGDWVATHTVGILTVGTGDLRVTTAGTNTASVVTVGGTQTLTAKTLTSPVINTGTIGTSLVPTTNDGAALGNTTNQFSDLFLAEGGVINWDNGDATLTQAGNLITLAGASWTFGANTAYFTETDNGNSSTADTIDWTLSNKQKSTLTGNCTFTFTAPGGACSLVLRLAQDATGSRTVTWPAAVKWSGGTPPTLTTTASKVDIITFYYDGTTYFGNSSLNYTP